jgi:hypothetical protein
MSVLDRIEGAAVIYSKWATRVLVSLAIIAMSSAAMAGDLGPTSQGAVSISITIPPHVKVSSGGPIENDGTSQHDRSLCIAMNQRTGSYHVALVASAYSQRDGAAFSGAIAKDAPARGEPICASSMILDRDLQGLPDTSAGPLMLLIIPD